MYDDDFRAMFFEFLHEYSDTPEMLNTLKPFIEYGWGAITVNGIQDEDNKKSQLEFIEWMAEYGASLDAIEAIIKMFKGK